MKSLPPSTSPEKDPEVVPITPRGKKREGITLEDIAPLRKKGLSYQQIGKLLGVSKQAVHMVFKKAGYDAGTVENFRKNRASIFADLQRRLLMSMTDEEIKKMSPRDRVVALGICFDKERLEVGQSTINLASLFSVIELAEKAEMERLSGSPQKDQEKD
jgi:transcriptional regulator